LYWESGDIGTSGFTAFTETPSFPQGTGQLKRARDLPAAAGGGGGGSSGGGGGGSGGGLYGGGSTFEVYGPGDAVELEFNGDWFGATVVAEVPAGLKCCFNESGGSSTIVPLADCPVRLRHFQHPFFPGRLPLNFF
jgi:hypothetical protein